MALLKDVAADCGLSVTTVSDALRGTGSVSLATRERVRAAADRLGYKPDPMASGLRARRFSQASVRQSLPIIITSSAPPDAYGVTPVLAKRATELGYAYRFEPLPEKPLAVTRHLRRWMNQGVAGVVFNGLRPLLITELPEWRHFGLVSCPGMAFPPPCHRVGTDPAAAVTMCVQALRAKGYRAIGLAISMHEPEIEDDRCRHAAALLAHAEALPGERLVPIFREPFIAPTTPARFVEWFVRHRPDAVIGFNDIMRWWLEDSGWRGPRHYAFATLHYTPRPPDSGHDSMDEACARTTIELLDQMIRYRETGWPAHPRYTKVSSRWIEGTSTPPASANT